MNAKTKTKTDYDLILRTREIVDVVKLAPPSDVEGLVLDLVRNLARVDIDIAPVPSMPPRAAPKRSGVLSRASVCSHCFSPARTRPHLVGDSVEAWCGDCILDELEARYDAGERPCSST